MLGYFAKFLLVLMVFVTNAALADPAILLNEKGVALSGYDPVAYFTEKKPVVGQEKFSAKHEDATYWFSSEAHRVLFVAEPSKYVPQYGGYCAYAASLGRKGFGNPLNFDVINNKLYINYNDGIQKRWSADSAGFIQKADAKWEGAKGAKYEK